MVILCPQGSSERGEGKGREGKERGRGRGGEGKRGGMLRGVGRKEGPSSPLPPSPVSSSLPPYPLLDVLSLLTPLCISPLVPSSFPYTLQGEGWEGEGKGWGEGRGGRGGEGTREGRWEG
jgi:hypothetical protein